MDFSIPSLQRPSGINVKYLARRSWIAIGVLEVLVFALLLSAQMGAVASVELPGLPTAAPLAQDSRVLDVKGRQITLLHGEQHRIVVQRNQISDAVIYAVLAAEDHKFYEHGGVNGSAVVRALVANVKGGGIEQGGSTITQQYVRNAYSEVGKERTLSRKVNEAWLATRLEKEQSKEEILLGYLNTIYFGRGAYGIEAAAREYFNKPARSITLHEAAYLAGIIKAPQTLVADVKASKIRRDYVIDRMAELGWTSAASAQAAKAVPLRIRPPTPPPVRAAYFVEYVRRLLITPVDKGGYGLTDRDVYTGGLTIHTTLDLDAQAAAERAVRSVLPNASDPEAAMVAMSTSGEIRALVGGRHFTSIEAARGFNYATQISPGAGRSAGSTFKPFALAAYLRAGFSPLDTFRAPSRIQVDKCGDGRTPWRPANYGNNGYGSMNVIRATEESVNTVYAQMAARVGGAAIIAAARDAGVTSPMLPVCSSTLGVFGVTPLEMARSYATFAARGLRPEPLAITKIEGPDGTVIAERKPRVERTIEPKIADQVNAILARVVTNGTGRPARIGITSAGKTGTTEQKRDAWYVGYTPAPGMVAAVWMGYPPDANGKIRIMTRLHGRSVSGGGFGGRIWAAFMREVMADARNVPFADVEFQRATRRARDRIITLVTTTVIHAPRHSSGLEAHPVSAEPAPPPPPREKPRNNPPPPPKSDPTPEPEPEKPAEPTPSPEPEESPPPSPAPEPDSA